MSPSQNLLKMSIVSPDTSRETATSLTDGAVFQSLIVALVFSQLDYCNSVLFGLPANLIQRLQYVQNAAARLVFRIRRSQHITPALTSLQ